MSFEEGSTFLGSATLTDGVAQFSTTPTAAGVETITIAYGGDASDESSSTQLTLTVGQAPATLTLGDLNVTYDGSPQARRRHHRPRGTLGHLAHLY